MEKKKSKVSKRLPFDEHLFGFEDHSIIVEGFTLYPPEGTFYQNEQLNFPAYINGLDYDREAALNLTACRVQFNKTKDPLSAIEAFIVADQVGFYPPIWAIKWLIEGLKKYIESKGKDSLNEIFVLKQKRFSLVESAFKEMEAKNLVREVSKLVALKVKPAAAVNAVANKSKVIGEGTLKRKYSQLHGNNPEYLKALKEILLSRWSPEEIQNFKDSYLKHK